MGGGTPTVRNTIINGNDRERLIVRVQTWPLTRSSVFNSENIEKTGQQVRDEIGKYIEEVMYTSLVPYDEDKET